MGLYLCIPGCAWVPVHFYLAIQNLMALCKIEYIGFQKTSLNVNLFDFSQKDKHLQSSQFSVSNKLILRSLCHFKQRFTEISLIMD